MCAPFSVAALPDPSRSWSPPRQPETTAPRPCGAGPSPWLFPPRPTVDTLRWAARKVISENDELHLVSVLDTAHTTQVRRGGRAGGRAGRHGLRALQ